MATEALNFRRIGTPSYRTYRVLQAQGHWAQIYRSKVADHGDQKGALIFPEQLLSLNQNRIYAVGANSGVGAGVTPLYGTQPGIGTQPLTMTLSCVVIERFFLWSTPDQCLLTKAEQVLEFEEHYHDQSGVSKLQLTDERGARSMGSFASYHALFTSKGDAVRWLQNYAQENLRKMIP